MTRARALWAPSAAAVLALATASAASLAMPSLGALPSGDGDRSAGGPLLARLLIRNGGELLRQPEPSPRDYEVALRLAEWAVELAPESVDAWRNLAQVAAATEGIDGEAAVRLRQALTAVCRLDPDDDTARLQLLTARIDEMPTAEARIAAYRTLLSEANRPAVGTAVAARLAFDLSLLLYRSGQVEASGEALALAVALDPAFPAATEMAAGFFRHRSGDPAAEAELLMAAALANPSNPLPLRMLASLALGEGAFASSRRLLELLAATAPPQDPELDGIVNDLALSLWGEGRGEEALLVLDRRRREVEIATRERLRREDPEADSQEIARLSVAASPRAASLAAVLLSATESPSAGEARDAAILAVRRAADAAEGGASGAAGLSAMLEAAVLHLWLGGDPAAIEPLLAELPADAEVPEALRQRVDGWRSLRRGEAEAAIAIFEALGEDPASRLGTAVACEQLGRRSDAARIHLELFRNAPSSPIGLWSRAQLARLLGREVPPGASAESIERLVASMPETYDRVLLQRRKPVSLSLRPRQDRLGAFEPLVVEVEIFNNTDLPLAISPSGPIEPNLGLLATATVAQLDRPVASPPLVVSVARRLRLEPRERLVVPVDLSESPFGSVLDRTMLAGSTVQVRAILNMRPVPGGALQPGPLGDKAESSQIRVEGVRVGGPWIAETLAKLRAATGPATAEELADLVLLAAVASAAETRGEALPPGFDQVRGVWPLIRGRWREFDPASRGFLLASIPMSESESLASLVDFAIADPAPEVALGILLGQIRGPDDPRLAAAARSGDRRVEGVAALLRERMAAAAEAADPAAGAAR